MTFLSVCLCCLVLSAASDVFHQLLQKDFIRSIDFKYSHRGGFHVGNFFFVYDDGKLTPASFYVFCRVISSNFSLWLIPKQHMTTVNITAQTVTLPTGIPCRPRSQRRRSVNQKMWGWGREPIKYHDYFQFCKSIISYCSCPWQRQKMCKLTTVVFLV